MTFLRTLTGIAAFMLLVFLLTGPAVDQEQASGAGVLSEREVMAVPTESFEAPSGLLPGGRQTRSLSISRSESTIPPTATHHQRKPLRWWVAKARQNKRDANKRQLTIFRLKRELASREIGPTLAIRVVFGAHAASALRVAWCESRWHTGATNGQYLGLFQMGSFARSTYGHSWDALGQARAAYRYFVASGRDWSPWECKP